MFGEFGLFLNQRYQWKNATANISLVVLAFILTLVIAEVALRLSVPKSDISVFEYTTATPRYKVMKPNIKGMAYGVPFETNNAGFRDDRPWSGEKHPNEFRIAVLGDSYTVSAGVEFHSIFTQLLQTMLQKEALDRQIRVLNLGVAGYNIVQYQYVFTEVGLALKPDYLVVCLFPSNDFNNATYEQNKATAFNKQSPPRDEGIRSLYLYKTLGWKIENRVRSMLGSKPTISTQQKPIYGPGSDGWEENASALLSLYKIAKNENIPFLVALLPEASNFEKQRDRHEIVKHFCLANGIRCIDLLDEFISSGTAPGKFMINVVDAHPNTAYNSIVARKLAESLGTTFLVRTQSSTEHTVKIER